MRRGGGGQLNLILYVRGTNNTSEDGGRGVLSLGPAVKSIHVSGLNGANDSDLKRVYIKQIQTSSTVGGGGGCGDDDEQHRSWTYALNMYTLKHCTSTDSEIDGRC